MNETATVTWHEGGAEQHAHWLSESGAPAPRTIVLVDDATKAAEAYGHAAQGTALLWRGDFHNARQLLTAMARRADRRVRPGRHPGTPAEAFHRYRQAQAQRARTLGALLVPLEADYALALRRAPDVRAACTEAFGPATGAALVSLRALLGAIGAHQWHLKGIEVPAAGGRIHPHYGVFAPVRAEYVDLVGSEPLPASLAAEGGAFDIGTGTGVLAAVLVRRGVRRVVATDVDPRALACARDNFARLGISAQVELTAADLFPPGRAELVVCNPPWLPARPSSRIERGIYDPDSQMLRGFLGGLAAHLAEEGEGWLLLSDLAEHLGLRTRAQLLGMISDAGLLVAGRSEAKPVHRRAVDAADPLHRERAAEVTSLWRLRVAARPADA